jgi:hypothetical protein
MQADATVAPTCIDIIYILHVYLSLCVITIYCKCVSTNKYCLLSTFILKETYVICLSISAYSSTYHVCGKMQA